MVLRNEEVPWVPSSTRHSWGRVGKNLFISYLSLVKNSCLAYKQNIFFCRVLIYADFFWGKQPLCKQREDYTLFHLELPQELFPLNEIRSRQPGNPSPLRLLSEYFSADVLCISGNPPSPPLSTWSSVEPTSQLPPPPPNLTHQYSRTSSHCSLGSLWLLIPLSSYHHVLLGLNDKPLGMVISLMPILVSQ